MVINGLLPDIDGTVGTIQKAVNVFHFQTSVCCAKTLSLDDYLAFDNAEI